ncbi:MAG: hypothetical protein NPIRA02_14300 [Nitrospirales bacterium]|nr:MAG: hypothetical protein NPIRA02_14300 [Nitrospirales bacterium]
MGTFRHWPFNTITTPALNLTKDRLFTVLLLFLIFQMTACSETLRHSGILEQHAIIVDKAGTPFLPIEPSTCQPIASTSCEDSRNWSTHEDETYLTNAYEQYVDQLIGSINRHFTSNKSRKILLYVHGGLNRQESSNERAGKLVEHILNDTQGDYYPIFVNWDSALFSSYGEHLTSVRQGKTDRWAWVSSPTYLATDLGRGVFRAPMVWWSLIANDLTSWPSNKDNWFFNFFDLAKAERDANTIAKTLSTQRFPFWLGRQVEPLLLSDQVWGSFSTALTYPIKFFSSPWIDALGKSAWDTMLRRTDLLFHTENEFQTDPAQSKMIQAAMSPHSSPVTISGLHPTEFSSRIEACTALVEQKAGLPQVKAGGALSIFLRKLAEVILQDDYSQWSVTLVGHSMGAIIVNHMIRDFGACLPIDNVVFMAAASTTNDYKDSVFPFLEQRHKEYQKQGTAIPKVYHLMLHELAETSETNYWNLPPTGSLLVWIDNFLSTPKTPLDRTSGRFTNFMLSLHTTPDAIREYISIKRFPGGGSSKGGTRDGIPENHSDFSSRFRFWKEQCWKVPDGNTPEEKFKNERKKNCFY